MRALLVTLILAGAAFAQWPTSPLWTPEQLGAGVVTQRFDASTLGLGNSASVNSWPDSSGNGYTATPANAGVCTGGSPTFQTAQQNGLGIVRLGGTQCFTTAFTGTGTAAVFVVAKLTGGGGANSLASQDSSEAGNGVYGWSLYPWKYGAAGFCRGVNTELNGVCSVLYANTGAYMDPMSLRYSLLAGDVTGNTSTFYVDGRSAATATSTATKRTLSSFSIGAEYYVHALANPITGDFGEVITTNPLTDAQRNQITNYLSSKWFLAPPQTYEFATFHTSGSDIVLNIMTSSDAAAWTDSPNSYFKGTGGPFRISPIRDPSIALINGTWYIVHTNGAPYFSLGKSADRGLWQYIGEVSVAGGDIVPGAVQAPEWFIDEDGSVHVLFTMGAQVSPVCPVYTYEVHPTAADFSTWSTPVRLTADDTCVIDPFLLKIGGTYNLFVTQKGSGTHAKLLSATSLLGPYTTVRDFSWANEGPSVIRMDGKWRLYWDPGSGGLQYSDCAGDPATCTWTAATPATMPYAAFHGTAIRNPGNPAGLVGGIN